MTDEPQDLPRNDVLPDDLGSPGTTLPEGGLLSTTGEIRGLQAKLRERIRRSLYVVDPIGRYLDADH